MSLKVACILHSQNDLLLGKVVLAENIKTIFLEITVETGTDLGNLAGNDSAKRKSEIPILILEMTDVLAVLKTVTITAFNDLIHLLAVALLDLKTSHLP